VPRPEGKSMIDSKWLYKVKHAIDGSIEKYKTMFLERGSPQSEGVDYEETFTPAAKYTSIKTIMSILFLDGLYIKWMQTLFFLMV
jgi:hypothetical protein